ncbi:ornithine cyclodeaminase family protein [Nonomuraea sp. NPDC049152]|uniref:ornithine cyclodeaminase family protein n=1 Tax=Nonomuraea sp. NPDC049152 TaxID=3154350 RepID=UPI0033FDAA48
MPVPSNTAQGLDSHQGAVLLFSGRTGEALALLNASAITELRSPAVSAIATDVLARPDATQLAVLGAGVQGAAHVRALAHIRPFRRITVTARDQERCAAVCARLEKELELPIEPCADAQKAVEDADVVVTATTSTVPVLERSWIRPGTHVNAIGSAVPSTREVDTATMVAATVFVDHAEAFLTETGDYLFAAAEKAIGPEHLRGTLGKILTGVLPGRTSEQEITLFDSVGLAVEDLFAARRVYSVAAERGLGTRVDY